MALGLAAWTFALSTPGAPLLSAQDAGPQQGAEQPGGSLFGGRLPEPGQALLAGAAGWPWVLVQLELAPVSGLAVGVRGAVLYGSPVMALETGVGGELAAPVRVHLHGEADLDVAAYATPAIAFGEASIAGDGGTLRSSDLGWAGRLELGLVIGYRPTDRLTLLLGAGGHAGWVHTPSGSGPAAVGAVLGRAGVEGFISADTMLLAVVEAGIGLSSARGPIGSGAGEPLFRDAFPPLLRVCLGLAYRL